MIVIGIGHRARQGKDTLARFMVVEAGKIGIYAKQYAFASGVYSLARRLGMKGKDGKVLQALGTDVIRKIDPHAWVEDLAETLANQQPEIAIITDVRFPNEASFIKEFEYSYLIKVTRPGFVIADRDPNHESETALADYPWPKVIYNSHMSDLLLAATDIIRNLDKI